VLGTASAAPALARVALSDSLPGQPTNLSFVGSLLYVVDPTQTDHALVLDARNGQRLPDAIPWRGDSVNAVNPWTITEAFPRGSGAWFYDMGKHRAVRVIQDPHERGVVAETVTFDSSLMLLNVVQRATRDWIGSGLLPRGRLAILRERDSTKFEGPDPPGDVTIPIRVRGHAFQSSLAVNETRDRIALGTRHAGQIQIFDGDGHLLLDAETPVSFAPSYTSRMRKGSPSMVAGADLRFGYIGLTGAGHHLYGLFSGRLNRAFPRVSNLANTIHIFGWDGKFCGAVTVEDDLVALAVDPAERNFYGLTARNGARPPALLRYDFPRQPNSNACSEQGVSSNIAAGATPSMANSYVKRRGDQ
jgi:hypothetical protein